jgi:UDP-glucose 4-epimerase
MRCLITGGAGFIGSHLSDVLLARGHDVHILDDLSTGAVDNFAHLKSHPRFAYTIDSATNRSLVAELVDMSDVVYHLAAAVGVELIVESPARTIDTNVHCTEVLLDQAAKKHKPVFVASTSEVYGKSTAVPFSEDSDLVLGATNIGRWSYAISKALDECLALAYWKERRLPTVVGRLFNTVGPRQTGQYGMVIPRFVRQALAGQPLTVYGDGTQRRVFCHVGDVTQVLADLMEREDVYGEVFNIGGSDEVSIAELAELVRVLADSDSEVVMVPYDDAYEPGFEDMARRVPDTEKIHSRTGWEPQLSLQDMITDVIEHHRMSGVAV